MDKYHVIRLESFMGGMHLSRGLNNAYDKSLSTLHSDTLKSALFVSALRLYGSEKVNKSFLESFLISSAFPFYHSQQENRYLYFFPKPEVTSLPFSFNEKIPGIEKKLKKLRFFEKQLFEQLINDHSPINLQEENLSGEYIAAKDTLLSDLLRMENCDAISDSSPYQHVHIPKDYGADSEPYYVDKIHFHENAGLFCLLKYDTIEIKAMVEAAFRLLADSGIGTDRNIGNGQFSIGDDTMELNVPIQKEGGKHMNLSLYCPEKGEIDGEVLGASYYNITKRGGYVSSPKNENHLTVRKRSVYMFKEGSLFPYMKTRTGKIANLKPKDFKGFDHPVWRDGRAIFIPFNYETD